MAYTTQTQKIDKQATDGLAGVHNSLAYRIHEIEKHFHSEEHWYGNDGDGTASTANNLTEWELTAGTGGAYGTAIKLFSANDVNNSDFSFTPVKFDSRRIVVTQSSTNDVNYMIQLWDGDPTVAGIFVTELPYRASGNATEADVIELQQSRQPVTGELWGRVKCETNSARLQFIIGVHAYPG